MAIGLVAIADPTARAARGRPAIWANSVYETVVP
jgi:hypothetical protein